MLIILLVLCVVLMIGGLPTWGYHTWGAYPSSLGLILVVVLLVLLFSGRW